MKNLALFLAVLFVATNIIGCGKKKDETAMDGLNGVVSENVVSVESMGTEEVPVVVENAESLPSEMAAVADVGGSIEKPTAKQIQTALKNAGFYTGKVDGDIGPKTKRAIEAFQSQNGLKADGKVGAKTWRVLSTHLNASMEVSNPSDAVQTIGQ